MREKFDRIKELIAACEGDISKAHAGVAAAGLRMRKNLQQVRNLAQELRKEIIERRHAGQDT